MEKKNFNEISLEDSGLYDKQYNPRFKSAFERHNITNVGQILDDDLMNEIIQHCPKATINSLRNFIDLFKYKYLGIPLSTNGILDEKYQDLSEYELGKCFYSFYLKGQLIIDPNIIRIIKKFLEIKKEKIDADKQRLELIPKETYPSEYVELKTIIYNETLEFENLKIIDIIKGIVEDYKDSPHSYNNLPYFGSVIKTFKLQIESYEQSKKIEQQISQEETQNNENLLPQQEHDTLVILREQLFKLIDIRDNLNAQIEDLQQKINELSKTNTEGGANK